MSAAIATQNRWSEPREVQFVVERCCPNSPFNSSLEIGPFAVWVWVPSVMLTVGCRGFLLTKIGIEETVRRGFRYRQAFYPAVCEHMGHVIE